MADFIKRPEGEPLNWESLGIEPTGSNDAGPCECCGFMSRTIWGFVHAPSATLAAYFVQWTLGNPEHGANFDLVIGEWEENTTKDDRRVAALEYRVFDGGGEFMVIDAASRPVSGGEIASTALFRDQVVGKPIANDLYAIVDAIFMKDDRLEEIRTWG